MGQSREKIVRRLVAAQQAHLPVSVRRRRLEADETEGFVVAVLEEWVVMQDLVEAVHLDTVVLLRLDRVTAVGPHRDQDYVRRAVAGIGVPLEVFECASDVGVADLLRIVDERSELVCVYLETDKTYWLNIGKIRRIGAKRLDLHFIGRDGVWVRFVERWKLEKITRIEFGGRYIRALEQFGDPMPTVAKLIKR